MSQSNSPRKLWYLLLGKPSNVIAHAGTDIFDLKRIIREDHKSDLLSDVDAGQLVLWKLKDPITLSPMTTLSGRVEELGQTVAEYADKVTELHQDVSEIFPHPLSGHLHFTIMIIKLPTEASSPAAGIVNARISYTIDDSTVIPRDGLVRELSDKLDMFRLVQIRGTPATGKTFLLYLYHRYLLQQNPDASIGVITAWKSSPGTYWDKISHALGPPRGETEPQTSYILIDDAQDTYEDTEFWRWLKIVANTKYRVALFCSYGNPGAVLHGHYPTSFPVAQTQRILLLPTPESPIGLFLTLSEIRQLHVKLWEFGSLHDDVLDAIFEWTQGHAGAVAYFFERIKAMNSQYFREGRTYDLQMFGEQYPYGPTSDHFSKHMLGRGLPCKDELQGNVEMTMMFRHLLSHDFITRECFPTAVDKAHNLGWIYAFLRDDVVTYELPTPLHASCVSWFLDLPKEDIKYNNLQDFTFDVLSKFTPFQLFDPARTSATYQRKAPEVQYQNQFYHHSQIITFGGIGISPEFACGRPGRAGRIDFYVGSKKWGIELTREGSKLQEHVDRFGCSGAHGSLLARKLMEDYILVDCHTTQPRKPHNIPRLFHAVFDDNKMTLQILDCWLTLVKEFSLLSH